MDDPVMFFVILLLITEIGLAFSLTYQFLTSPRRFIEKVFSANAPGPAVWREKSRDASDWIVLYYTARIFVWGALLLAILLTLHKMGIH
jgi:hypothetical protein